MTTEQREQLDRLRAAFPASHVMISCHAHWYAASDAFREYHSCYVGALNLVFEGPSLAAAVDEARKHSAVVPDVPLAPASLPEKLAIHVENGQVMVTDPLTSSSFALAVPLTDENVLRAIARHRDRWRQDELQYAPALQALRDGGFLPVRSVVAAVVATLLLCMSSPGSARLPNAPYPRGPVPKPELISIDVRTIDNGRRQEHILRFHDGSRKRFIFEVPPR